METVALYLVSVSFALPEGDDTVVSTVPAFDADDAVSAVLSGIPFSYVAYLEDHEAVAIA